MDTKLETVDPNWAPSAIRRALRFNASLQMKDFPQYEGVFTDTLLFRAKRDFTTKLGLAWKKGDYLIGKSPNDDPNWTVCWSQRNACWTVVRTRDMENVQ